ncbi:TIGR04086 family membrane protein [Paenibacillus filicis]|uniref:TIGR04086 family membrane protein n=1 Tax=Paenibacillus gyeongsangnamensis TaxID=3388067 RepID=A0ABT4QCJ2_9BACL|nr:TIGR04086 family membrane protein [Paenibacillus filicis]MCZ8514614.1 TIGR04086 family membrane protein [Paenibacillus filicis]
MKQSPLWSGFAAAGLSTLVGTLAVSLLLLGTSWPESSWLGATLTIHGIAMLLGGIMSGKRSSSRGWYHGGLLGLVYTGAIWMIGFLAFDNGFTKEMLVLAGLAFVMGALGGIIGVNLKK